MLQRIQTVYMLASVIAIFMMLLFPLASFLLPTATFKLGLMGLTCLTPEVAFVPAVDWGMFLALVIMLLVPLVAIFLFKNRKLQLRFLIFSSILDVLFFGLFFWISHNYAGSLEAEFAAAPDVKYNFLVLAMPVVSIVSNIMAMRGIIFDIALIKSLDRLR